MNFEQWWTQLPEREKMVLGMNNARFVWNESKKHSFQDLAKQIEQMPFGNTSHSFAVWIREQI